MTVTLSCITIFTNTLNIAAVLTLGNAIDAIILIYSNTAARGLTDIMRTTPEGTHHPRKCADISVKPQAHPCYNIYVTLSIVVYSIARNYPGITTL